MRSTLSSLLRAIALCTLALLAQAASAQTADNADEMVTMNMRNADIRALIQWMAEQTQKQVVIDPRVKGQVTVLSEQPMSIAQAYEVFLATLDVYGFAASEVNGILRIYPAAMAKSSATEVVRDFDRLGEAAQVVYVVQLDNVSSRGVAQLLMPLMAPSGYIQALPETNSIVIADDGENVKRLAALARQLDHSGDIDVDVIRLDHADAAEVVDVIASLNEGAPATESPLGIAADERSNSILLSGDPARRQRVTRLIAQLDQPIARAGNTRVSYLRYLDAAELVPILQGVTGTVQKEATEATVAGAEVNIQASESANAVVMTGPPSLLDELEDIITQLDIRRAQVLVEAIIVEVSQDFARQLGVEWRTSFSGEGLEAATNFGLTAPPSEDNGSQVLSLLGDGLNLGFFRNGDLRALLRAVENTQNANILSTPSVLTLDNQEAEILVGSNIPLITGQTTTAATGTDNPFTTFERRDIGVTLKITPQINRGDAITLDILQEVETVAPSPTINTDVVTDKRSLTTKVLVDDEAILVLGGLISDESRETVNKVPLLGDVPLLGALFRNTTNTRVKRNLMVFIHPVIVDSEAVAEELSSDRYRKARELQQKYLSGKFKELMKEREVLPEYSTFSPREQAPQQESEAVDTE